MATKAIEGGAAKRRIRKVFGNIHEVVQMPNLIEVQRESYEQFLRSDPSIGYVSWTSSIMSWSRPSSIPRNAASGASPMPRRCASRCA